MLRRTSMSIIAFAACALLATSAATARRTVIDEGDFLDPGTPTTACTIGGDPCTATTMPFFFDFGSGSTNLAYIYDSGIVSFGAPIPDSVDPEGSFADFGVPVIAPLYVPEPSGVAGPYLASSGTLDAEFGFPETLPNLAEDLFLVTFLDPSTVDEENFMAGYVWLILDASADELRFEFIHGQSNTQPGEPTILTLPNIEGTLLGYSLFGHVFIDTSPDIGADDVNAFSVTRGGAVPEPATWAMMLLGFGAAGVAIRRAKRASPKLA